MVQDTEERYNIVLLYTSLDYHGASARDNETPFLLPVGPGQAPVLPPAGP